MTVLAETWPVRAWSAATFSVTSVNLSPDSLDGRTGEGSPEPSSGKQALASCLTLGFLGFLVPRELELSFWCF